MVLHVLRHWRSRAVMMCWRRTPNWAPSQPWRRLLRRTGNVRRVCTMMGRKGHGKAWVPLSPRLSSHPVIHSEEQIKKLCVGRLCVRLYVEGRRGKHSLHSPSPSPSPHQSPVAETAQDSFNGLCVGKVSYSLVSEEDGASATVTWPWSHLALYPDMVQACTPQVLLGLLHAEIDYRFRPN